MSYKVKFHKSFYLPILAGEKTQTMRIARKRLDVKEGDVVDAVFPGFKKSLKIKITKIGYKQLKSVNAEDASLEGYATVEELLESLLKFYPNLDKHDRLYYYRFVLL